MKFLLSTLGIVTLCFVLIVPESFSQRRGNRGEYRRGNNGNVRVVVRSGERRNYRSRYYRNYYRNRHNRYNTRVRYNRGHYGGSTTVYTSCSPEVVSNNIQKTDALAESFLIDDRFSNEVEFKNAMNDVLETENQKEKLEMYLALVDANTPTEVAHFAGARESEYYKYEDILVKNTDLNPELAREVVAKMINAVKGN